MGSLENSDTHNLNLFKRREEQGLPNSFYMLVLPLHQNQTKTIQKKKTSEQYTP